MRGFAGGSAKGLAMINERAWREGRHESPRVALSLSFTVPSYADSELINDRHCAYSGSELKVPQKLIQNPAWLY